MRKDTGRGVCVLPKLLTGEGLNGGNESIGEINKGIIELFSGNRVMCGQSQATL